MRTSRVVRRAGAALLCLSLLATACTSDEGSDDDGPAGSSAPAGTVLGDGDAYEATIVRTDGGVPHITAEDLPSLSFGQGWASGEDHACDLADQIVKIEGERARWFGPGEEDANIDSDYAWRSIGIRDIAEEDWADAPTEVVELITAYADGWNAHLAEVGSDGLSDWCAGEEWVRPLEPVEVYAYARSITLLASSGAVADYIATAQPPAATEGAAPDGTDEQSMGPVEPVEPVTASNGWAIGSERSADGGGMLVANPHFPWEGQLRFWEVHLTIPGELDIYGVNLSGLPGIAIGFTEQFGWTHTVSAGSRFTAYRLDLVPGTPTSYRYGDEVKEMTSEDVTIEVLGDDGARAEQTRTMWRSHYGPVLDFPGVGWSDATTIAIRDANIDNDEFIEQYLAMMQADDLDELIAINEDITGVPLFNTIATSADGRAWYADTAATPNLSDEAIAAYDASLLTDPIAKVAADSGAILLDGSDPTFEWVEVDGARDPGLVPYSEMPVLERDDYVFNANDSFWVAHAEELLEGDYSPLHGRQGTARSPRTRENATVLSDTTAEGPSGEDGTFTLDELAAAAVQNRGYTSRALLDEVVERCSAAGPVELPALPGDDTTEGLPGRDRRRRRGVRRARRVGRHLRPRPGRPTHLARADEPLRARRPHRQRRCAVGVAVRRDRPHRHPVGPRPGRRRRGRHAAREPGPGGAGDRGRWPRCRRHPRGGAGRDPQRHARPDPRWRRGRRHHQHRRVERRLADPRPLAARTRAGAGRPRCRPLRRHRRRHHDHRLRHQQRDLVHDGARLHRRRPAGEGVPDLRQHLEPLRPRLHRGHPAVLRQGVAHGAVPGRRRGSGRDRDDDGPRLTSEARAARNLRTGECQYAPSRHDAAGTVHTAPPPPTRRNSGHHRGIRLPHPFTQHPHCTGDAWRPIHRRTLRSMRVARILLAIVVVWSAAAAVTMYVGGATTLGPVVFGLTKNHGIHLGDVVAGFITAGFAAVVTALLLGVAIGEQMAARRELRGTRERRLTGL